MTKDEVIETISKLPGVGAKKAEALYTAGFTTLAKLKAATVEELQAAEGIGPKVAQAVFDGLKDLEKGSKAEVEVREGKTKVAAKPEIVEAEQAYRVKIKPVLSEELKHALIVRAQRKSQEPAFRRYHHWYRKGMDPDVWRAPKGTLSKQRRGFKYRPPRVKVGYGKPSITRGLHPSGFEEVLVANPGELSLIEDPKTQAARIVGTVGGRKRALIESAAAEKGIRVLNPRRT